MGARPKKMQPRRIRPAIPPVRRPSSSTGMYSRAISNLEKARGRIVHGVAASAAAARGCTSNARAAKVKHAFFPLLKPSTSFEVQRTKLRQTQNSPLHIAYTTRGCVRPAGRVEGEIRADEEPAGKKSGQEKSTKKKERERQANLDLPGKGWKEERGSKGRRAGSLLRGVVREKENIRELCLKTSAKIIPCYNTDGRRVFYRSTELTQSSRERTCVGARKTDASRRRAAKNDVCGNSWSSGISSRAQILRK